MITGTPGKPGNLEARNRELPLSRRDIRDRVENAFANVQVIEVIRSTNYMPIRAYATRVGEAPGNFQIFQVFQVIEP
ncbi:hypothetical protein QLQ77_gp57 [Gordonia phage Reyja]|uniref:Uncharacterized protein n=1 Tax=Gordonia phage Reyja TaxID=2571250 RepID=A0A4D6T6V8_9CAUD|nr:hypothetical protein QLQ77_gp57 [Gordonia phage Reyja]QCG77811.1 hypothetical protein SEA_REYJA_57 [Gordonia phage Reyja]